MLNFFRRKKTEPKNLKEVLTQFRELEENFAQIAKELEDLKKEGEFFVQKVGIVRFNPFSDVGGDQSFAIALLNGQDSGIIITSLYTREGNRVYAKPIKKGESEYPLSDEEKKAIAQAKANFSKNNGNENPKLNNKTTGRGGNGTH
jgi:hypothetical protein